MDPGAKPAKAEGAAELPVAPRSRRRGGIEKSDLERRLAAALAQQAAIGEILEVIGASPADVQPVLDVVTARAAQLCDAPAGRMLLSEGDVLRPLAHWAATGDWNPGRARPVPLRRTTIVGRAALDRVTLHHPDVLPLVDTEYPDARENILDGGIRAVLAVPLMHSGGAYGGIVLFRPDPRPFTAAQIALVETFARQAAIAIHSVRLFHETKEALEQQTATSDVLRAISRSPADIEPVLEAVVGAAARFCDAPDVLIQRLDDAVLRGAAAVGPFAGVLTERAGSLRNVEVPLNRGSVSGRAALERRSIHVHDLAAEPEAEYPVGRMLQQRFGHRTIVATPLVSGTLVLGAIVMFRTEVRPFSARQIELLETFASQAVIAIENVRLFTALGSRNRELVVALEQQTATSDILRVISRSPTDVQPVFDTIAAAAMQLCGANAANVFTFDGKLVRLAALVNRNPEYAAKLRAFFPRPPGRETAVTRAIQSCRVVTIPDVVEDSEYGIGAESLAGGFRSVLAVPLVRDAIPIGGIAIGRPEPGPFPQDQIALLQTFADQAVIAIENVRLFTQLQERTAELTRSVGELRALSEIAQAVSSTLDLGTVLQTIVSRATRLAGMEGGAIYEYDESAERFHLHTTERLPEELVEALRTDPIRKGEGAVGRLAVTGEPVQVRDIADEAHYQSRLRGMLIRHGYRSLLAVPLLRDDRLLGGLVVNRNEPGEFAPEVIGLLKTFATQSALAIQNARLFREIEIKSRELEAASRHKSEFLANMSHELRTPLNAIIGFSEVLTERMFGDINDKQAEYLGDILESGRHLLSLINDILDLSKIEAGRMELEATEFDLPGAIENALTLVKERAHRRGIALGSSVDERVGKIKGDERKVKQVLLNLLSNALKFTPEGGRVDVRAGVNEEAIEISVADTGSGIAPSDLETVFEEFRQVGSAASKIEGTGLGLAISRKFVELHGGRIWATSRVGVGTTFTFSLPRRPR